MPGSFLPRSGYSSAAPGGDLIFCEAVLESGNELRAINQEDNLILDRVREQWENIEEILNGGEDKIPSDVKDFIIRD